MTDTMLSLFDEVESSASPGAAGASGSAPVTPPAVSSVAAPARAAFPPPRSAAAAPRTFTPDAPRTFPPDARRTLTPDAARALPAVGLSAPPVPAEVRNGPARPALHLSRIVADSTDRVAWLRARSRGITATDVAKLATARSVKNAAWEKLHGTGFGGNPYTDHGRAREPEIASWVLAHHGIEPSTTLFHAPAERRHLATPDGLSVTARGELHLAEIKTTSKPWRSIPRAYLRQVWWQQYVLGAERTLLVWEQHNDFVPIGAEPECRWIDRDEDQIAILVGLANDLIDVLARQTARAERHPPYDPYDPYA